MSEPGLFELMGLFDFLNPGNQENPKKHSSDNGV